ncbi:MAG: OB-fold nucleic acid binding domain-containing protein, partial [Patescibacteria group bacterium]|nr:OB-fold nucleic acid binding domain-containing protein [Patescibacteria group bacterium]
MESQNQENIGGEYADRLKKLESLKSAGINPYPAKATRDLLIADLLQDFSQLSENTKEIHLCGRLRGLRSHGNLTFANLEDESGSLQIALSKKELGDEQYKKFVKLVDVADFVEV